MSSTVEPTAETMDRLLSMVADCLTPEVAERIAALRAEPVAQARIDYLAELANEGQLTETQRAE
jgi:hypothetical protein